MPLVLLVEDNEDNRIMTRLLLETWKYDVVEAVSGEEAIWVAGQTKPDLILMDAKMPGMDGFETTRRLRQSTNTPIIFLSACAEKFYQESAHSAGANDYLTKPIDFNHLENMIGKYIAA